MIVLHDPDTLLHDTVELLGSRLKPALESPARVETIVEKISKSGDHKLKFIASPKTKENRSDLTALLSLLRKTHGEAYLKHLETAFEQWRAANLIEPHENILPECFPYPTKARVVPQPPIDIFARAGFFAFDMSSGIMVKTYSSVVASANLAFQAVRHLRNEDVAEIFALSRPPGHHCDGQRAGGYCYVNNAAVVVSAWRMDEPCAKAGILDLDFHHGNGTQEIFYSDPLTFYASIHGEGEFPYYTGLADELGTGDATETNMNFPLPPGSDFDQYLEKLEHALASLAEFYPSFLVISLGFDTFHLDPLGGFAIHTKDYEVMARKVRQRFPKTPAVILLEGGYVVEHLGANVLSFLKGWELI